MNSYKSSAELKGTAKEQLFGKYGTTIGAYLIVLIITILMTSIPQILVDIYTIPGLIMYYLINIIISLFMGIFLSGEAFLYLKVTCNQKIYVSDVFYGFKLHPDKALMIQLANTALTYICLAPMLTFYYLFTKSQNTVYMLLMSIFWVIGLAILIIVSLMISQAFYLLQDFPQYSAKELLKMSCRIMKGHKGRLFYIQLGFIPLFLLGILSCCIAFLWIIPYMNATMANFYMDLMKHRGPLEPTA